jgi:hypothetical protein
MKIKNNDSLVDELVNFTNSIEPKPNFIIISINVYNVIENSIQHSERVSSEISFPHKIGYLVGFEVYIDIHLPSDRIVVSWNKQSMRDSKIESILSNIDVLSDIEIDIF